MIGTEVLLPVGIEVGGQRYKRLIVDEMCGFDEENLSSQEVKGNASKANTALLRRIIQSIPGYVEAKSSRYGMLDEMLVRNMYQVDRDAAVTGMLKNSDDPTTTVKLICPDCGLTQAPIKVDLREVPFIDFPETSEPGFKFTLPHGIQEGANLYREGFFRFPRGADIEATAPTAAVNVSAAQTHLLFLCVTMDADELVLDRELIKRMPKRDRDYLMWMLSKKLPGYATKVEQTCFHCQTEITGHVDLQSFFDSTKGFKE